MKKPQLLVVDDEEIIWVVIKKALKYENFDLIFAKNGREGIELLEKNNPVVVVLDLQMPEMNGFAFLEHINIQPDDPYAVIVLTGHGSDSEMQKCYDLGASLFLRKPFGKTEFICQVQWLVKLKALEKESQESRRNLEREVEERKRAEEAMSRANQAKSEFLANMSHEFRTPMHAILSFSRFGMKKVNQVNRDKLFDYFVKIRTAGERLMISLNDILDLSTLETGRMKYNMMNDCLVNVIESIVEEFGVLVKEKGIELEIIIVQRADTTVYIDKNRIGQVMRNLIGNALKFSKSDDKIIITVRDLIQEEKIKIFDSVDNANALIVSVFDQGKGIPEDELGTIFEEFVQSSQTNKGGGGTGLGLSICKRIIEDHHGKIWAQNNPCGGAIFFFVLPLISNKER